jgi:hypothetical protein
VVTVRGVEAAHAQVAPGRRWGRGRRALLVGVVGGRCGMAAGGGRPAGRARARERCGGGGGGGWAHGGGAARVSGLAGAGRLERAGWGAVVGGGARHAREALALGRLRRAPRPIPNLGGKGPGVQAELARWGKGRKGASRGWSGPLAALLARSALQHRGDLHPSSVAQLGHELQDDLVLLK